VFVIFFTISVNIAFKCMSEKQNLTLHVMFWYKCRENHLELQTYGLHVEPIHTFECTSYLKELNIAWDQGLNSVGAGGS